ncbi:MAG: ABC-F family ATP-binding cassette domain-containing protein [Candidatus Ancaeobacter aquaticus]|nr:ABC-F family ATP-binding cassette domain-containing protein [Candidatus Ancaeobacter aquaticus]
MISIQNISKTYSSRTLLKDVTFSVHDNERVGIVGRNGHGKTTLFRILAGQETHDTGTISIPKDYSIGYLSQHIEFTKDTVLEEGCQGLPQENTDDTWKVEKILLGLGFTESDFTSSPDSFSDGYKMRLNLAKVLVSEPRLLLLDEPTNYLDIVSIRWLERFLNGWPHEIMIISHDRSFMDRVVTHIVGIHRAEAKKVAGRTQDYYSHIAQHEEMQEKKRLNDERNRKHMMEFVDKFRAKARQAGMAQSRLKRVEKMHDSGKLKHIETLSFSFNEAPFHAKCLMEMKSAAFSYDNKKPYLINNISFSVQKNDRICVVGKNGKGKTTFLRLCAEKLGLCEGEIRNHPAVEKGFFEQDTISDLVNERTVEEEITASHPTRIKKEVMQICGAMMFSGKDAQKKVSMLSGGERSRVVLGKLLVKPSNLLLLDEPTHHLDIPSIDALITAINKFSSAAIIVSHDEYFLRTVATKLIVFKSGNLFFFPGTYDEFVGQIGWDEEGSTEKGMLKNTSTKTENPHERKKSKQKRAAFVQERSQTLRPLVVKIEELEKKISLLEHQLFQEHEDIIIASKNGDSQRIADLSISIHTDGQARDILYKELDMVNGRYEKLEKRYED